MWRVVTLLFFVIKFVYGGLLVKEPNDLFLPVGATGEFPCITNSTDNSTMISWTITTRNVKSVSYSSFESLFNSYGIRLLRDTPQHTSVLLVDGVTENNGTFVLCTAAADGIFAQSDATLLLYGPPDPVMNFKNKAFSPLTLQLTWTPVLSNIPFNYSISITNKDNITDIIIIDQNTTHYLFNANQEDTCQKYNFTIKTVNDAGSSEVSEILTVPIPNVPSKVSDITSKVSFSSNGNGDPYLSLTFLSPDVCQYYPITSYRVTVQEQINQSDNTSDTHLISATNVTSNDSVVTLTITSLTADQHYLISISAINEVGTSQSTQEIEIYTSSVQRVEAVLSMNILHVTCYLAEYSVDSGCYVEVLYKNEIIANKTIVRTKNQTQLSGSIKLNLPDFNSTHSDLVVMAFDYNNDGSMGQLGFNVTPSLAPPTMTTPEHSSSTITPITTTTTNLPSVTPTVGTVASKSGFPQITLVVICGSALFGIIIIALIFVAGIVLTRRCIWRRKKSIQPYDKSRQYTDVPGKQETIENGTIISIDPDTGIRRKVESGLVEPYGVTVLFDQKPTEPLYQELPSPREKPILQSQSSTAPLLESDKSNTPPPPIEPRTVERPEPFYHVLEQNDVHNQTSINSLPKPTALYDEVPLTIDTDFIDGPEMGTPPDTLGSNTPSPTPITSSVPHIYHVLETSPSKEIDNFKNGSMKRHQNVVASSYRQNSFGASMTLDLSPQSQNDPLNSQSTISTICSTQENSQCEQDDIFDEEFEYRFPYFHSAAGTPLEYPSDFGHVPRYPHSRTPLGYSSNQLTRFHTSNKQQRDVHRQMSSQTFQHYSKSRSLPMSARIGMRSRCNSEPGTENMGLAATGIYDGLEKSAQGSWTLRRTLV